MTLTWKIDQITTKRHRVSRNLCRTITSGYTAPRNEDNLPKRDKPGVYSGYGSLYH